jgi:hypothetical protein
MCDLRRRPLGARWAGNGPCGDSPGRPRQTMRWQAVCKWLFRALAFPGCRFWGAGQDRELGGGPQNPSPGAESPASKKVPCKTKRRSKIRRAAEREKRIGRRMPRRSRLNRTIKQPPASPGCGPRRLGSARAQRFAACRRRDSQRGAPRACSCLRVAAFAWQDSRTTMDGLRTGMPSTRASIPEMKVDEKSCVQRFAALGAQIHQMSAGEQCRQLSTTVLPVDDDC